MRHRQTHPLRLIAAVASVITLQTNIKIDSWSAYLGMAPRQVEAPPPTPLSSDQLGRWGGADLETHESLDSPHLA